MIFFHYGEKQGREKIQKVRGGGNRKKIWVEYTGLFLTRESGDMVILDVMDDHILAPERYPENFVLISLLEVCQEWGGQEWGSHGGR